MQDNDIAITLCDYIARGYDAPGVRSGTDVPPWPILSQPRPASTGSPNNGGEFVSGRRELRTVYASQWLLALHDRNIERYATMVFDIMLEYAEDDMFHDDFFSGQVSDDAREVNVLLF